MNRHLDLPKMRKKFAVDLARIAIDLITNKREEEKKRKKNEKLRSVKQN